MNIKCVSSVRSSSWLWTLCVLCLTISSQAQTLDPTVVQGSIRAGDTYLNATLGMKIILPGAGRIMGRATTLGSAAPKTSSELSDCRGPLCGHPSIDVAIESPFGENPAYGIFLAAYKLPSEYQDPQKHTLKDFANAMIVRSLGRLWVPESGLTPIRLGARPAIRLLAHDRKRPSAKAFMYVSESNGYVFMLVAIAVSASGELRSAIENMRLSNQRLADH